MGLLKIRTDEDSVLHKVCHPVTKFDSKLHKLLDNMTETLIDAEGAGLAAPQVGILRRVTVVMVGEDEYVELINPEIIETSGEQDGPEGCLSVPGKWGLVNRPYRAKVRAQDRDGEWFEIEGEDIVARCFCHELEHLDGHLYTERVSKFLSNEEMEQWYKDHQD